VKDVERTSVGNHKVLHQCLPERTMKILENLSDRWPPWKRWTWNICNM